MQTKLYEKALQLDLASYDNTEFYNDFIWAIRESDTRAVKVLTDVCSLCSCVITLVGMGAVFAAIDWMAALVVLASSVLGFFVRTKANQIRYAKAKEMNPITRKLDYFTRFSIKMNTQKNCGWEIWEHFCRRIMSRLRRKKLPVQKNMLRN